jgi:hypothetical protein
MRRVAVIAAFMWACVVSAQPISGPVEGFIFDAPTRSLRAVMGSLGSAILGLEVFGAADYASVAPLKTHAITFRHDHCLIVSGLGSRLSATEIPGLSLLPEGVVWSSDGSVAVLYSRTGNWIHIARGLPDSATPDAVLSLSSFNGVLSAVAVSPHGNQTVIGITGKTPGLYELSGTRGFTPLPFPPQMSALVFSSDGETLYGLGGSTRWVFQAKMADLTFQLWPLNELQDPLALSIADNSSTILVAGGKDRTLLALDASSHQTIATIQLGFEPTTIEPLGPESFVLRPRKGGEDPLWSFRASPSPSVYFVPALPAALRGNRP